MYQLIKQHIKNPQVLKIGSEDFNRFLQSEDYKDFMQNYLKIRNTDLINVIAVDHVFRLKRMGILIRFGSFLPLDSQKISAVE
jgi:hypothetical protein